MKQIFRFSVALGLACAIAACGGDNKDSAEREAEAQKALQQGMQKEQKMMEGMVKGVETMEKKAADESKK